MDCVSNHFDYTYCQRFKEEVLKVFWKIPLLKTAMKPPKKSFRKEILHKYQIKKGLTISKLVK